MGNKSEVARILNQIRIPTLFLQTHHAPFSERNLTSAYAAHDHDETYRLYQCLHTLFHPVEEIND